MVSVATFLTDVDQTLFHYINGFCGHSLALDHIANRLESGQLKGLAFSATFDALWFQRVKNQVRQRPTLVLLLVAVVISLVVARICADLLPFRERPMFRTDIGYQAPLFHLDSYFENWSSFPSDNAAILFVMTTGFWLVSRWWGLLWLWFSLLALTARVYFGLHYPGDMFAGALIGITITIAINNEFVRRRVTLPILIFEKQAPAVFYGLLFPFIYEISTLFAFTRSIRHAIIHLLLGF
jgi:membrane-associated phospholipid phosphatase